MLSFHCLHCTASYTQADPMPGGGFICPGCFAPHTPKDLEAAYGKTTGGTFYCPNCLPHGYHGLTGNLTELAKGFCHCDASGGCKSLFVFPVTTAQHQCHHPGCSEVVHIDPQVTFQVTYFCSTHAAGLPTYPSAAVGVGCKHPHKTSAGFIYGPLPEWKCIDCQEWFEADYASFRPALNPYSVPVYSSMKTARTGAAPPPPVPLPAPVLTSPSWGGGFGWFGGGMGAPIKKSEPKVESPKGGFCTGCGLALSSYLDAYHGKDPIEAGKCSVCRHGRKR